MEIAFAFAFGNAVGEMVWFDLYGNGNKEEKNKESR